MRRADVCAAHPDQWLVIEALEAHSESQRRVFNRIAVVETCLDGAAARRRYQNRAAYERRCDEILGHYRVRLPLPVG